MATQETIEITVFTGKWGVVFSLPRDVDRILTEPKEGYPYARAWAFRNDGDPNHPRQIEGTIIKVAPNVLEA